MTTPVVNRSDIETAAARIAPRLRRTPLLSVPRSEFDQSATGDTADTADTAEGTVTLKLEYLQHSGTFKARGATNFVLGNDISPAGVTAASGGNHGAAVAWAAQQLGHRATIFVPTISAPAKVDRLRSYGAEVVQVGKVYAEALEACVEHEAATGATAIHAYEAPDVFAGAGTTGREFEAQVAAEGLPPLDDLLVACGGGGLVGGIATWFGPDTGIVACETNRTSAYASALDAGRPIDVTVTGVAADALGATRIGTLAFDALRQAGALSVLVDDRPVVEARRWLWDSFRIVVEHSAAVPVAALLSGAWRPGPGRHTGIVVCGANTSPTDLA